MVNSNIQVQNHFHQPELKTVGIILDRITPPDYKALPNFATQFTSLVGMGRQLALEGQYTDYVAEQLGVTNQAMHKFVHDKNPLGISSRSTPEVFSEMLKLSPETGKTIIQFIGELFKFQLQRPAETRDAVLKVGDIASSSNIISVALRIPRETALGLTIALVVLGRKNFENWQKDGLDLDPEKLIKELNFGREELAYLSGWWRGLPHQYAPLSAEAVKRESTYMTPGKKE